MNRFKQFNRTVKELFLKIIQLSWLFFIASCMSKQPSTKAFLLTKLFFTDSSCNAPCWQNLFPGSSTLEDVEQMVLNASEQELQSYQRTEIDPDSVRYSWYNEMDRLFVNISVFRGVVDFISLTPTIGETVPFDGAFLTPLPQGTDEDAEHNQIDQNESVYTYKLADVFQVAGEPAEYATLLSTDFHGTKLLSIVLFYTSGVIIDNVYFESQQDGFDFGSVDGCNIKISPNLPIQRLHFTNITTLSDTLPGSGNRLSFFSGDIYPWNGFDNIRLSKCNS